MAESDGGDRREASAVESTAHGSARLAALGSSWEEISLHGLLTSFTRSSQEVPEETGTAASKLRSGEPRGSGDACSDVG